MNRLKTMFYITEKKKKVEFHNNLTLFVRYFLQLHCLETKSIATSTSTMTATHPTKTKTTTTLLLSPTKIKTTTTTTLKK